MDNSPDNRGGYKSSGPTEGGKSRTIQKGRGRGYIRRAHGECSSSLGRGRNRREGVGARRKVRRSRRRRRKRRRGRRRSKQVKSENHSRRSGMKT